MDNHSCIIGLLHHIDYSELCTLEELKRHIAEQAAYNLSLDDDPLLKNRKELRVKVWTLKSYADFRRSTDLTRFKYCPQCGKRIDWAALKGE